MVDGWWLGLQVKVKPGCLVCRDGDIVCQALLVSLLSCSNIIGAGSIQSVDFEFPGCVVGNFLHQSLGGVVIDPDVDSRVVRVAGQVGKSKEPSCGRRVALGSIKGQPF